MNISKRTGISAGITAACVIATIGSVIYDYRQKMEEKVNTHVFDSYFDHADEYTNEQVINQIKVLSNNDAFYVAELTVNMIKNKLHKSLLTKKYMHDVYNDTLPEYILHGRIPRLVNIHGYYCILILDRNNNFESILVPKSKDVCDELELEQIALITLMK